MDKPGYSRDTIRIFLGTPEIPQNYPSFTIRYSTDTLDIHTEVPKIL